jgi:predicted RNA-binding protein YlxR (DUF448 family)
MYLVFNPDTKKMSLSCDNETLIVDNRFTQNSKGLYICRLSKEEQKQIAKKLINNVL